MKTITTARKTFHLWKEEKKKSYKSAEDKHHYAFLVITIVTTNITAPFGKELLQFPPIYNEVSDQLFTVWARQKNRAKNARQVICEAIDWVSLHMKQKQLPNHKSYEWNCCFIFLVLFLLMCALYLLWHIGSVCKCANFLWWYKVNKQFIRHHWTQAHTHGHLRCSNCNTSHSITTNRTYHAKATLHTSLTRHQYVCSERKYVQFINNILKLKYSRWHSSCVSNRHAIDGKYFATRMKYWKTGMFYMARE